MYTRSYRKPTPPVLPPDYSGTALSDAAVPPPAPLSKAGEERNGETETATVFIRTPDRTADREIIPDPAFSAPENPVSGFRRELSSFGSDDWLLLGLIFLFLTGSSEEVKDQLVLLIVLGVLFFTGRGGFPLFG